MQPRQAVWAAALLLAALCGLAAAARITEQTSSISKKTTDLSAAQAAAIKARLNKFLEYNQNGEEDLPADDEEHDDNDPEEHKKFMLEAYSLQPSWCEKNKVRKRFLKVVKEMPFVGLFPQLGKYHNKTRYEASGITYAKGSYWVVFDDLRPIAKIDLHFSFRGEGNMLIGQDGDESQFEGLAYMASTDTFLAVRESHIHHTGKMLPLTEELKFADDLSTYSVLRKCPYHFELEDENKGFEGIYYFERDGKRYMMGLCESNYCATIVGDNPPGLDRGHGRLVLGTFYESKDSCGWNVTKVIDLPFSAFFLDYAGIAFNGYMGSRVAVVSQEDAAVWVGEFDWEALEFHHDSGTVYHFPRDANCGLKYCNVEGLNFIDTNRLVFTSDKSKITYQPWTCHEKDQSVHIMAIPPRRFQP